MTILNLTTTNSKEIISNSTSTSEEYSIKEGRPPLRKMTAQDFDLILSAKSLLKRMDRQNSISSHESSLYSHLFRYRIKTNPYKILIIKSTETLKALLNTPPKKESFKPSVLKFSHSDVTVTQLAALIAHLSLSKCKSFTFHEKLKPTFEILYCLSNKMGSLEHIDFAGVKFKTRKDQEGLIALIKTNKETLENINLSNCRNLDHRIILAIFDCKKLKTLNLSNVRAYYDLNNLDNPPRSDEMDAFSEHTNVRSSFLLRLFQACPNLEHLNVSVFLSPFNHHKVLDFLQSTNPNPLKTFICNYVEWIRENNEVIQGLTSQFPHLETLSLNGTGRLTSMPYYPSKLTKLKSLMVSGQAHLPFTFIIEDVSHFAKLESLDLSLCHHLPSFPLALFLLRNGRNLKKLNLDIPTFAYKSLIQLLGGIGSSQTEIHSHKELEEPIQLPEPIKGIGEQLIWLAVPPKLLSEKRIQEILSLCPNLDYLNGVNVSKNQK